MEIFIILAIVLLILSIKYGLSTKNDNTPTTTTKIINIDLTGFTHYEEFPVAGVFESDTKAYIIRFLKKRYPLELIPEPDNKHSKSAISINASGFQLGYVPEEYTEEVLEIIKSDHKAIISEIYFDGDWIDVYVKLYFKEQ